jgi:hypothetical protein
MPKSIAHPIPVRLTLPSEVVRVAKVSAEGTNTDFKSLLASSLSESHHDPAATNKRSTATGAYQMTERTWLDLMRRHGAEVGQGDAAAKITTVDGAPTVTDPADRAAILALRNNSALAGALAARYSDENRTHLGKILGHPPTENQVRMAYLLGASGAGRLLKAAQSAPDTTVDKILPAAVKSNPGLFVLPGGGVKTASEAVASLDRHFDNALHRVNSSISAKLSDASPIGVPTDDLG